MDDRKDVAPDDLPDDDPDVVAGMERLRALRAAEGDVAEFVKPPD